MDPVEEVANRRGDFKKAPGVFEHQPKEIGEDSNNAFDDFPANSKNGKETAEGSTEIHCRRASHFELSGQVSEPDSHLVELLASCLHVRVRVRLIALSVCSVYFRWLNTDCLLPSSGL